MILIEIIHALYSKASSTHHPSLVAGWFRLTETLHSFVRSLNKTRRTIISYMLIMFGK